MRLLICVSLMTALLGLPLAISPAQAAAAAPHTPGRALLVGINHYRHPLAKPTPGSEEDAIDSEEFIKRQYGFIDGEVRLLLGQQATAANIAREFRQWLINGTRPGDRVFFLYSGHGTRLEDDNGDEEDGFDEALAPYDASEDLNTYIRDDLIGEWIKQLAGRSVVMVFDSCFSGTISRGLRADAASQVEGIPKYFPSPKELAALKETSRSLAKGDGDDYVIGPDARSRDLSLVVDKRTVGISGVVIFSAAQANQTAYGLKVSGRNRGALSYAFNEAQRGSPVPLGELEQRITAEIARLHRQGLLKGNQEPAFEVLSDQPLADLPLFASTATGASPLPANPQSRIKLSLSTTDGRLTYFFGTEKGKVFGEALSYRVSTDTAGYVYLLVFSEKNVATCLFPNKAETENWVEPGTHRFPRALQDYYYAQEPEGKDVTVALLSATPLKLGEREVYTWDEIFDRLRDRRFSDYVRTRGIGTKPATAMATAGLTNWQSASLVLEARRRDR